MGSLQYAFALCLGVDTECYLFRCSLSESILCLLQFGAPALREPFTRPIDKAGQHPQSRIRPSGETFFEASVGAIVEALLINNPSGGYLESVLTVATHLFALLRAIFHLLVCHS